MREYVSPVGAFHLWARDAILPAQRRHEQADMPSDG
jgi:hypothetical protein